MTTTQAALIDALKQAEDALPLCLAQLYHDGVMIDQSHPKRIAVTAAENCMAKIADILSAADAAPTEQARIAQAEQRMLDILVRGVSITRIDPTSIRADYVPQAAPVLDATGEREYQRGFNDGQEKADVFRQRALKAEAVCVALSLTIAGDEQKELQALEREISAEPKCPLCDGHGVAPVWLKGDVGTQPQELPVMSDAKRIFLAELESTEQTMRTEGFPVDAERVRHAIALLSRKPSADKEASK